MNKLLLLTSILILQGCATVSPDKIIAKHSEKKEVELSGNVEFNFQRALKLLPKCMPYLGVTDQVSTSYGEVQTNPLLSAYVHTNGEEKQIALGNNVSGGTNLFVFSPKGENTLMEAYWKRWNKSFEKDAYSFYDVISGKDLTKCDYEETER